MDCLEGVHEMQEVWIFEKMLPDKAASVMVHLGTEDAARKLLVGFFPKIAASVALYPLYPPQTR